MCQMRQRYSPRFEQNFGGFRGIHTRPNMLSDETALFPLVWTELWWIQRYTYPTGHVVRWDSVIPQGLTRTLVNSEVYIPDRTCCQMRQRYSPRFEQNFGGFRGIHTRPDMLSDETALFPEVWTELWWIQRYTYQTEHVVRWDSVIPQGLNRTLVDSEVYIPDRTCCQMRQRYSPRFEQNFGGFRGIHSRPNMLSDETALFPKVWTELWWIQRYTYPTGHVVRWDSVISRGLNRTLVDSELYVPDRTCCQMRQRYSPRFEQNFGGFRGKHIRPNMLSDETDSPRFEQNFGEFRGIHTRPNMLSDETASFPKVWPELWWIQRYTYLTAHARWDSVIPQGLNRTLVDSELYIPDRTCCQMRQRYSQGLNRTLVDSEVYIPDRTCCQMRQRYSPRSEQNFVGFRGIHTRPNMLSDETALFPKVWTELWWIQRYTYQTEHVVRWDSVIPQGLNRTLVDSEVYIPDRTCQMRQRYSPRFEQNFGGFRGIHTRPDMLSDETALFPKVWPELWWIQRYTYPTEHVVRWVDSEVYIPDRTCCQMRQRYSPRFEQNFGGFRGIHTRPDMLSDETVLLPKFEQNFGGFRCIHTRPNTSSGETALFPKVWKQLFFGFRGIHTRPDMLSDETALFPKVWTELWWIQEVYIPDRTVVRWDSDNPKVWT